MSFQMWKLSSVDWKNPESKGNVPLKGRDNCFCWDETNRSGKFKFNVLPCGACNAWTIIQWATKRLNWSVLGSTNRTMKTKSAVTQPKKFVLFSGSSLLPATICRNCLPDEWCRCKRHVKASHKQETLHYANRLWPDTNFSRKRLGNGRDALNRWLDHWQKSKTAI